MAKWRAQHGTLTLIGLVFTLGVALLPLERWGETHILPGNRWGREVLWWVAVFMLLHYVIAAEHRRLSSIGFAPQAGGISGGA